jgi:hypothetical protein
MSEFDANTYSEAELEAEFGRLFPLGFAGPDVVQELAPDGWETSPLLAVYHPSLEQTYDEAVRMAAGGVKSAESNVIPERAMTQGVVTEYLFQLLATATGSTPTVVSRATVSLISWQPRSASNEKLWLP